MVCAPSKDSDQPGQLPSLIRVFAVRSMDSWGPNVSSCGQGRLWSDWVDAQADLSLHWAQWSFCWLCHEAAHLTNTLLLLALGGIVKPYSSNVLTIKSNEKKDNKQCLSDTPRSNSQWRKLMHVSRIQRPYKMAKFEKQLFNQKPFFWHDTSSCTCSIYLYC